MNRTDTKRPRGFRATVSGIFDSIAEARRMQADFRRKYPHLGE